MRLTALLTALLFAAAPLRATEAGLTIAGSDLLGAKFGTGLTALAQRAGLSLKLNLTGSHTGLDQLQTDKADLALLVFAKDEKPPGAPWVAQVVAYHTVVAIAPAKLPLEQLSFAQLRAIYCASEGDQPPKSWDALGVPSTSEWAHLAISPVISGSGGGLSYDLFRDRVLPRPGLLRAVVTVEQDGPAALKRVSSGLSGLAIVPVLPPGRSDLKALALSRGTNAVAFGPTPENIHSGDYPVSLPLHVVFNASATKRLLPLLRVLYGNEAVTLWQDAQLVPLPARDREDQIAVFEAK